MTLRHTIAGIPRGRTLATVGAILVLGATSAGVAMASSGSAASPTHSGTERTLTTVTEVPGVTLPQQGTVMRTPHAIGTVPDNVPNVPTLPHP